ncbi:adenosylcobinamide amidohydrolase [Paenibacillus sp. J2TS4]|uniref:adenosylcobinamide amidohydrolase n=1 Tax=Paenibacillus sp. J2TS4 TaxID=2807194 RepID=UPI001B0AD471|nr:adenosylcobinamide amidohydrolase [Paenibacillus sp. J2TS4]GIP33966.1 adenosylcobinamide amidohydrolase [Paenibacillus sp. J2TS4]
MTVIDGVQQKLIQWDDSPCLLISAEKPLYTLNSSIWRGGFSQCRYLINRQVNKDYDCEDPVKEMEQFLTRAGLPLMETAGMLTAARVQDVGSSQISESGIRVSTWVTAGLSNPSRAGSRREPQYHFPGTINTIVLVEAVLTDSAMVNAVITATEAKTAALQDLEVQIGEEEATATGTTTDAIIIAATQTGVPCVYAGTATELGYRIGRTVYDAVYASGQRNLHYWRERIYPQ